MSYQKHLWVSKEIITSKNLNHLEDGVYQEEQRAILAEQNLTQSVGSETLRAESAESALSTRVGATENAITTLNGNDQVVGSVDYKIAQATTDIGGYKVVMDHTAVSNPSNKYIYLEPDNSATGTDKFSEWVWTDYDNPGTFSWKCTGEVSLDLSGYVQKTDYATTSVAGVVKPDGTTITVNNGVISSNAIGGVSSFNGRTGAVNPANGDYSYSQISDTPTLGSAAALDVPTSGNASSSQVVKGDDSRLSNARTPTSHTHTKSQITDFPTIPGGVKIGTTRANATDTTLYFIRS